LFSFKLVENVEDNSNFGLKVAQNNHFREVVTSQIVVVRNKGKLMGGLISRFSLNAQPCAQTTLLKMLSFLNSPFSLKMAPRQSAK